MVQLSFEDRNRLIDLLISTALFQTQRGRQQLLSSAGLEELIPQIDLEGPPLIVVGEIVDRLQIYGRVTFEHQALGISSTD